MNNPTLAPTDENIDTPWDMSISNEMQDATKREAAAENVVQDDDYVMLFKRIAKVQKEANQVKSK